jgi:hypothetical protein
LNVERQGPRGGVVGPVVLIGLGALLLLNNLGMLDWGVWDAVFRLWPVLLIGVGLEILIGRRSVWGSALVALLLLGVLAGTVYLHETRTPALPLDGQAIERPLGGARAGEVRIDMGVGRLVMGALEGGELLVQGSVPPMRDQRVVETYAVEGSTAVYHLRSDPTGAFVSGMPWSSRHVWIVNLTTAVPLALDIRTGVGQSVIDLSHLDLSELSVRAGVGQTRLTLPRQGAPRVHVNGGVGEITVIIPAEAAARVRIEGGLGPVNAGAGFVRSGDDYLTPAAQGAAERMEITLQAGVGVITLRLGG